MEIPTSTTSEIPGKKVKEVLGIVTGNTIRARHVGRDIMAGLKNLVGGEIKSYTEMMTQSREEAFNRMINMALDIKADAVINVRFTTSMVMGGAAEILAYGTAVKF
ncbi:MAG: YbjQ family protein [Nanoarchaeota archaeon]|nr:YbjQ family protein [Nanoarchaeota archaeon]